MHTLAELEHGLTAHIRDPDKVSAPADIEPRRTKIYSDLFYNNIEDFISSGFPILRELINDKAWHAMVRDFMISHQCHTPYFLEISQEFLLYLQNTRKPQPDDLPFLLELAHYEWVELALDVADTDLATVQADREGDLLQALPVVSPLAWSLMYQFPVHQIGSDFVPTEIPETPSYLVVYRNRQDSVEFMQANAVTARLLELLQTDGYTCGLQVLTQLADEMQHPQPQLIIDSGVQILEQLLELDIILGTR